MGLEIFKVMRDHFEPDENTHLCFPCSACRHRHGSDKEDPCVRCDWNLNAKPDDELPQKGTEMELTKAAADVIAERRRQVAVEGWTPEHDDRHGNGEMAVAASCYALHAHDPDSHKRCVGPMNWPWEYRRWKPRTARRDLVKAGALILAEIERLDRLTPNA